MKYARGKRSDRAIEVRTFEGGKGTYVVYRLPSGGFHTFMEVEAKAVAVDCGGPSTGNTRKLLASNLGWISIKTGQWELTADCFEPLVTRH